MCAEVLFNSLNQLRKRDTCKAVSCILSLFPTSFYKFYKTEAPKFYYSYQMTLKLL